MNHALASANPSIATLAQATAEAVETAWQLQTYWSWAPWSTVLFIALAVAIVIYCYAGEISPVGRPYRALLATLRLCSIALVMIMLSELLLSQTRSGLPRLAILLDRSASMGITDPPDASLTAEFVDRIRQMELGEVNRLNLAKSLVLSDGFSLADLWQNYDVAAYSFADNTESLPGSDAIALRQSIGELSADGSGTHVTRLGDALAQVTNEQPGTPLAAVVVFSDGRNTAGRSLSDGAEILRRASVPLYAVGIGAEQPPVDLAISDLRAEDAAFVDDLLSFSASVRSTGLAGKPVRIELRREGQAEPVAVEKVTIPASGEPVEVQLLDRPQTPGEVEYSVTAAPVAGELEPDNNALQHVVKVHDEKIRVLLAAGYPSYEFRYLKNLLDRDRAVESHTFLQEADPDSHAQDESAVPQFPVELQEMDEYDVIVLMDLDPRLLPRATWSDLKRFVTEQGGGLVMVAGPRYFPALYRDIPEIAQLAPLQFDEVDTASAGMVDPGFAFQPTPIGGRMPALQIGDTATETESLWSGLPPLYWFEAFGSAKPAAQVTAVHPGQTTADGRPLPLAALQYVGAGQVLLHAVDSTWRWRYRVGDVFFARYWIQSLRALARAKLLDAGSGVELLVNRQRFELGEPAQVQVRFRDPRLSPPADESVTLLLQSPGQPDRQIAVPRDATTASLYETELNQLEIGRYRVMLASPQLPQPPASLNLEVVAPPGEFAQLELDRVGLTAAAAATHGKYYSLAEAERLFRELPRGRRVTLETLPPIELWNRWWMLLAISTCLISEWILRKPKAML